MTIRDHMRRSVLALVLPVALTLGACTASDGEPDPNATTGDGSPETSESDPTSPSPESPSETGTAGENGQEGGDQESEGEPGVDDDALTDFSEDDQASENWDDFILEVDHNTVQVITEIRHGVHDGYERAVLEFSEDTDLAYQGEYIEPRNGAGAVLAVLIKGTTGGPEAEDAARLEPWQPDTGETVLVFIEPQPLEGGKSVVHIGLDEERPFRIHDAEEPMRVILDIATE